MIIVSPADMIHRTDSFLDAVKISLQSALIFFTFTKGTGDQRKGGFVPPGSLLFVIYNTGKAVTGVNISLLFLIHTEDAQRLPAFF